MGHGQRRSLWLPRLRPSLGSLGVWEGCEEPPLTELRRCHHSSGKENCLLSKETAVCAENSERGALCVLRRVSTG